MHLCIMLDDHNISTNQLSFFCRLVSIPLALYVCMYYRVDGVHGDVYSSSVIQNVIAHKGRPIALLSIVWFTKLRPGIQVLTARQSRLLILHKAIYEKETQVVVVCRERRFIIIIDNSV